MDEPSSLPDWLTASAAALDSFLQTHPDAEHQVREILDKRLQRLSENTWNDLWSHLQDYLGQESLDVVGYAVVQVEDQPNRLREMAAVVSPRAMDFLRSVVSLYGRELYYASLAAGKLPNDWRLVNREVLLDNVTKGYTIRTRITKYTGEEVLMETTPDSMLDLVSALIQTLLYVPVADVFPETSINLFLQRTNDMIKFLRPPGSELPTDAVQPAVESASPKSNGKSTE